jgi:hypothetical protein
MALEATHMRFALDLKDKYQAQDLKKYLAGAVYPDSRYITGLGRNITHRDGLLNPNLPVGDFKSGWQTHVIYDFTQYKILHEQISELNNLLRTDGDEKWFIYFTAVKVIEDMANMQAFDIKMALGCLVYVENPNSEDLEQIKKYHQIIIDLYQNKKVTTVEDNYKMWLAFGVSKDLCEKVKEKTEELLKDKILVEKIRACYKMVLDTCQDAV